MKKALTIILSLLLLLSVVSCGSSSDSDNESQAPESPSPSAASPDASPSASPDASPEVSEDAGTPVPGGTLKIVTPAEGTGPIGLPWQIAPTDVWLTWPILETLLKQQRDGTCIPGLAESWTIDTDTDTLTLQIREGVKFHDGSDFNAEVAKWNIDMIHDNSSSKPVYDNVTVLGPYELSIHYPNGINNSTTASWATTGTVMISKEAYETNGADWSSDNPTGTGPFKFVEYVKGAYLKTERFDDYWQEGLPYLDGVELDMIKDVMTQNIALQSTGDQSIDILVTSSGDQVQQFEELGYTINGVPIGPMGLLPSSDDPDSPFAKLEVRQALSYAIDRDAIVNARGYGVWQATYQINQPGMGGHSDDPDFGVPRYDPEKAKELLAQAGYPDGFETTLVGQTGQSDKDAVVAIQSMLAAVGISANVEFPDSGGYAELRGNGWDGILVQSNRNMPTQETLYSLVYGSERMYFKSMLHEPELQELIDAAVNKLGDNKAELIDLQGYILDNAFFIPLYCTYESYISKPNVKGYMVDGALSADLFEVWIAQ